MADDKWAKLWSFVTREYLDCIFGIRWKSQSGNGQVPMSSSNISFTPLFTVAVSVKPYTVVSSILHKQQRREWQIIG